jgi:hypothetical protein
MLGQLSLNEAAGCARLNLRHAVHRIDPLDVVHASHVDRDDWPFLIRKTPKRLGYVRAATIGHQDYAGVNRCAHNCRDLRLVLWIHDVVRNASEAIRSDRIYF